MDPIREEKLQAMSKYNYNKSQFLNNLLLYSFTVLTCSLFCFYPYWFPSLCSSMNHFLFISLPNVYSFFFSPKCLFIVGNAIVIFLIGESKFSSSQSPVSEIYDEYVERSRSHRGVVLLSSSSTLKEKKEEKNLIEESVNRVEEVKEEKGKEEEEEKEEEKEEEEEEEGEGEGEGEEEEEDDGDDDNKERDGEEESGLPVEELNKRVEEFIARVNKQRWLEAKSFISLKYNA